MIGEWDVIVVATYGAVSTERKDTLNELARFVLKHLGIREMWQEGPFGSYLDIRPDLAVVVPGGGKKVVRHEDDDDGLGPKTVVIEYPVREKLYAKIDYYGPITVYDLPRGLYVPVGENDAGKYVLVIMRPDEW
ncbi:hypothetical protein [Pyrococcus kukulkanii]|uniref:hypothetical protein n=1 Tax=Pyrococcus kukulkanii TaxID=1609559 RepID=UPI0035622FE3